MKKAIVVLMLVAFVAGFATVAIAKPMPSNCWRAICLCEVAPSGVYKCWWKVCCDYDGVIKCYIDYSQKCVPN